MKIILELNQYVKQTCEKIIQPLLRENDCKDIKINTTSWEFIIAKSKPNREEWGELVGWKVEESQQKQTIQVN